ncbi:hypothetical protein D3C86_2052520 [compost metagenome]
MTQVIVDALSTALLVSKLRLQCLQCGAQLLPFGFQCLALLRKCLVSLLLLFDVCLDFIQFDDGHKRGHLAKPQFISKLLLLRADMSGELIA